jgi:hypothetical protein
MIAIPLEEKIRRCIERHPDWGDVRIANSIGCRRPLIQAFREGKSLSAIPDLPPPVPAQIPPMPESGLISLDKVLQRYDIRAAILRELALVPKGKLLSEVELCQRAAGTDKNRFRRTVENNEAEFRPLRIRLKLDEGEAKWYWAGRETIEAAQRIRDL